MSVGQVAERFGVRKVTLRFYEQLGLLAPHRRGRRTYRPEDLRQLAFVQLCQAGGLSLEDIGHLLAADGENWQGAVRASSVPACTMSRRSCARYQGAAWSSACPAITFFGVGRSS